MKTIGQFLLATFAVAVIANNLAAAQTNGYSVIQRGVDSRVWQKTETVNGTNRVHHYTELATGMHYTNAAGQLVESKEEIALLPNGGAAAIKGRHKVYFPTDIYNGALEIVTPDGRHLHSRPLGVSYDDGSNTVFIATLTNSVGYLASSNQVIYPNAFAGIDADLVCTYRKAGFESDLVFRQRPPAPEAFGLNSAGTVLQMVTEFFNTADPQATASKLQDRHYALTDSTLKFGTLKMGHGRAFAINATNTTATVSRASVYKRWLHLGNRTFLIEELPLKHLAKELAALPQTASVTKPAAVKLASAARQFPPTHEIKADARLMLAAANPAKEPGVVLDYYLTLSSYSSDFSFDPFNTYYVSDFVDFEGATTVTISGDAIIKFADGAGLDISGTLYCWAGNNHPTGDTAILTSKNDDSVGEIIEGSTGTPTSGGEIIVEGSCTSDSTNTIDGLNFYYSTLWFNAASEFDLWNCTFNTTNSGFTTVNGSVGSAQTILHNVTYTSAYITASDAGGYGMSVTDSTFPLSADSGGWVSVDAFGTATNFELGWQEIDLDPYGSPYDTPLSYSTSLSGYQRVATPLNEVEDGLTVTVVNGDVTWLAPSTAGLDTNNLAYQWEMNYFDMINLNPSTLDSGGINTLGYDYANSLDPNVIYFTLSTTNNYVNTTSVSMQLNITGGVPSYYAVLVNDTNWDDATWQTYAGTNINVSIGSDDGVYVVSVGLRGLPDNATPTWENYSVTLDTVPPVVTISNPALTLTAGNASATVNKPYLQLQGLANKPLASLSYDINNVSGFAANQDAFVTDQTFDTNQFDFTTNFFRAYDVPLATNDNWITLRVTDRAGNTTMTNFDVVLDYSTATTPPVVHLIWPQDGMAVSGTSITIRGTMSDETGTVYAQVLDEDGNTNIVTGLVERNGMFWIENVPVNGESQITLQATDAAGNVTTKNFTVEASDLILTITGTPAGDDLWHGAGMVYGTVSDPSATVTVNGKSAVVDGSFANADGTYNWTAANVPIYGQGTATFDAMAYSEQNPNTPPVNTSLAVEMQPYVVMTSYNCTEVQKYTALDYGVAWYQQTIKNQVAQPLAGPNGQWVLNDRRTNSIYWYDQDSTGSSSGHDKYMWGISPTDIGQEHYDDSDGDIYDGPAQWPYWDELTMTLLQSMPHEDQDWGCAGCGPSYIWSSVRHYWADGVQYHWDLNNNATFDLNVNARTQMKLLTGGKAQVNRKNLFEIDAGATEILRPPLDYEPAYPWWDVPAKAVDNATLLVAGKSVGADGKLWLVLPDNSDADITVIAPGKKHYDANSSAQKYKLTLIASTNSTPIDLSTNVPEFCVGEKISFSPNWIPNTPPIISSIQHWDLPGEFVNESYTFSSVCTSYRRNDDLLTNVTTSCWPINKPGGTVGFWQILTLAGGHTVTVNTVGQYNVYRPSIVNFTTIDSLNAVVRHGHAFGDSAADLLEGADAKISLGIDSKYAGVGFITQLITIEFTNNIVSGSYTNMTLDNDEVYPNANKINVPTNAIIAFFDTPQIACNGNTTYEGEFYDYIRFQPSTSDSIPVTIGRLDWYFHGTTSLISVPGSSQQDYAPVTDSTSVIPDSIILDPSQGSAGFHEDAPVDTDEFPEWHQTWVF